MKSVLVELNRFEFRKKSANLKNHLKNRGKKNAGKINRFSENQRIRSNAQTFVQ